MTPVKRLLTLGLLCIAVGALAHAQDAPATLTLDRTPDHTPDRTVDRTVDRTGDVPVFLLQSTGAEAVFLPDCRGIVWELLDADAGVYRVLPAAACGPSAPPVVLPAAGLRLTPPVPPHYPAALRVIATVATGCRVDRPFELAGCKQTTTLTGANITLQAPRP